MRSFLSILLVTIAVFVVSPWPLSAASHEACESAAGSLYPGRVPGGEWEIVFLRNAFFIARDRVNQLHDDLRSLFNNPATNPGVAIIYYENNIDNPVIAPIAAQAAWTAFNLAVVKVNAYKIEVQRIAHAFDVCRSRMQAYNMAVYNEINSYVGPDGSFLSTLRFYEDTIELLRRRLPPFLHFGNFEYPLPGITGTIDQFIIARNPILRYINIVMISIIAGIVAIGLISIVVAGYMYVTAGGNSQRVATAKSLIGAALLGIVLALGAFLILNTIGTQFASGLREPSLTP